MLSWGMGKKEKIYHEGAKGRHEDAKGKNLGQRRTEELTIHNRSTPLTAGKQHSAIRWGSEWWLVTCGL